MATDALESMGQKVRQGNNCYLCISADSRQQADEFFEGLSAGAEIEMNMQDASWGDYFGILTDKFGIKWMISFSEQGSS